MMSLRMKLVHICLLFCLLFSLASFAFVGAMNENTTPNLGNHIATWVMEDNGSTAWSQTIAWGGCQPNTGGTC